jgi:hypothetical protein
MHDYPPISWGIMTENAGGRLVGKEPLEVEPVGWINGYFDEEWMGSRQPKAAARIGFDVAVSH